MRNNLQNILGLTQNESKVYSALIEGTPPDISGLVTQTGLPRSRIYEVLSNLAAKNLVEKRSEGGYRLVPPKDSVPLVLNQIEKEYEEKRGLLKEMEDYLHKVWNQNLQPEQSPGVEIYNIEDAHGSFLRDIASVNERIWIAAADVNTSLDMRKSGQALSSASQKNFSIRYLASTAEIADRIESRVTQFQPFTGFKLEILSNKNLHASFVLLDSLLYLFFFGGETSLQATTLRTTSRHLVKSFEWIFDSLWLDAE